jgi:hypothetical protein
MKMLGLRSPFWSFLAVMLMVSLTGLCLEAQARGGGFSGGSFRGGGGYATGPRGGAVAEGPRGGEAARGPYGGAAAVGPRGGTAYRAPYYGPGYRPGYGGVAAGVAAGVAVGAVVATLPARAAALSVAGQNYYYDGSNYYQPCYQGTDVSYCVVADPNQ